MNLHFFAVVTVDRVRTTNQALLIAHKFQLLLHWEMGGPVSFQVHQYNQHTITDNNTVNCLQYSCVGELSSGLPVLPLHHCTLMVLYNLAKPDWVSVPCDKNFLSHQVCFEDKMKNGSVKHGEEQNYFNRCKENAHILRQNFCFTFTWSNKTGQICKPFQVATLISTTEAYLNKIMQAVSLTQNFPTILLEDQTNNFVGVNFYKLYSKLYQRIQSWMGSTGFFLCCYPSREVIIGTNLMKCTNGGYFSVVSICDGIVDCANDESDEELCHCHTHCTGMTSIFPQIVHAEGKHKKCTNLYRMTMKGVCTKYDGNNFETRKCHSHSQIFNASTAVPNTCNKGSHGETLLINDLIMDCLPQGDDEPLLLSLIRHQTYEHCVSLDMIPCMEGHPKCYFVKDICVFRINHIGHLLPCRNGGHLQNCQTAECDVFFKCVDAYCVPWSFVCNGHWDCPRGDDEKSDGVCTKNMSCAQMFKCKKTNTICVHMASVCDGQEDCICGDDELFCDLHNVKCPAKCSCLLFAIECHNTSFTNLKATAIAYLFLKISYSQIVSLVYLHKTFRVTNILILEQTKLQHICQSLCNEMLRILRVIHNLLNSIRARCLASVWSLNAIDFQHNHIEHIQMESFQNLSKLTCLHLSHNPLHNLPPNAFKSTPQLQLFYFVNSTLDAFGSNALLYSSIVVIVTDDFHVCCLVSNETTCLTHRPWYKSCGQILPLSSMKVLYISVSVFVFVLNMCSIFFHISTRHTNRSTFTISVLLVNLCDVFCCVYLGIIWISDIVYEGIFVVWEENWKSGNVCFVASGTLICFAILCQTVLLFMTLSRLMVVINPVDTVFSTTAFTLKVLLSAYVTSFLAGVCASIVSKHVHKEMPMALCLPFVDPQKSSIMIEVQTWFIAATQTVTSGVILLMHVVLVSKVKESDKAIRKSKEGKNQTPIILQLTMITMSNILCWFPTNAVFIAAMFLVSYPVDLVIWTAVIALPLNSVVNPLVFLCFALRKKVSLAPKPQQVSQESSCEAIL